MPARQARVKTLFKRLIERFIPSLGREVRFRAIRNTSIADLAHVRSFEPELLLIPPLLADAEGACLDVGANVGEYCYALQRVLSPSGIHAFEPIPETREVLRRLFPRIRVWSCALSDQAGTAQLSVPTVEGRHYPTRATLETRTADSSGSALTVETRTLDEVAQEIGERIAFVKIDVEGHEANVIAGGRATFLRDHPTLLVELEQRHSSVPVAEKVRAIEAMGYVGYFFDLGTMAIRPIHEFDPTKMQREEDLKTARYVNNFIFLSALDSRAVVERLKIYLASKHG